MSYSLHGAAQSTCVARVRVTAAALGIIDQVKLDAISDFKEIYSPEWTEHQPFNQMPWIEDKETGFEMYESRAIAKYLAVKHNSPLVPKQTDTEAYARFEQACSIEQANFDPAASGLGFELVFCKLHGKETDPKRVETLKETLAKRLAGYERVLSKSKYLAGDSLTLADLFHLPYGKLVADLGVAPQLTDTQGHPNVARWWKEITSLPAWQTVLESQAAAAKK